MPSTKSSPWLISFAISSVLLTSPLLTSANETPLLKRPAIKSDVFSIKPLVTIQKGPNLVY